MKQTLFILSVLSCLCTACSQKSDNKEDLALKKLNIDGYVYIEQNGTLHAAQDCFFLKYDDEGIKGVKRIRTKDITDSLLTSTCPDCVSDKVYDVLDSIAKSK